MSDSYPPTLDPIKNLISKQTLQSDNVSVASSEYTVDSDSLQPPVKRRKTRKSKKATALSKNFQCRFSICKKNTLTQPNQSLFRHLEPHFAKNRNLMSVSTLCGCVTKLEKTNLDVETQGSTKFIQGILELCSCGTENRIVLLND